MNESTELKAENKARYSVSGADRFLIAILQLLCQDLRCAAFFR
ncbi:hypothetical protein [Chromatium okenii]|nr:hypothetical protein [Chromatium okenii]